MRSKIMAAVLAAALVPSIALAAVSSGSVVRGTFASELNSKSAGVGQTVVLNNVTSANGSGAITGGRLYGHVTKAVRAGQGRKGEVDIAFDRLVVHGTTYTVNGQVTDMKVNTKTNAGKEILGAVGGMLLGNMIGKTIFHSKLGGAAGAAGGFFLAKNNREDVTIPSGSVATVQLRNVVRRQSR